MTAYLYLLGAMCTSAIISVFSSAFTRRNWRVENISSTYNVFVTAGAVLCWAVMYFSDFSFEPKVLLYALGYGIFYTTAFMGLYNALQNGSIALTAFVKQLSLIAVAVWGFIFWGSPMEVTIIVGMLLIIAALYLCFKPDKNVENKPITLKWVIFASMLLVGNAGCSILQKMQQTEFHKQYGNMLMFFGCLCSFLVCLVMYLKGKRCRIAEINTFSLLFPVLGGCSSAILNLFIILLINSTIPESVFFPGIAVGGLILTTVYSVIVCKERLRPHQWAGLVVGAVALVFLNI